MKRAAQGGAHRRPPPFVERTLERARTGMSNLTGPSSAHAEAALYG